MIVVPAWAWLLALYLAGLGAFALYASVLDAPVGSDDDEPLIPPML